MVRADYALTPRDAKGSMYLVDATAAHTTNIGALPGALRRHRSALVEEITNYNAGIIEMMEAVQSPTILKKVTESTASMS